MTHKFGSSARQKKRLTICRLFSSFRVVFPPFLDRLWGRDISMSAEFGRQPERNTHRTWSGTQIRYRPSVTTNGNTTLSLRTRDGINVAGDFQIAPKDTGLQRSIISVRQVCDRGNIITFRSTGGMILNEFTGSRIEFERAGGVYRL